MLTYKFHKEFLEEGVIYRPVICVEIEGQLFYPILDSGCDTTVISESFANAFGIEKGKKVKLRAFRESFDVYQGKINIRFLSKQQRQDEVLQRVPCLIVPKEKDREEDADFVLGVSGIFDRFKIIFDLKHKKIIMQRGQN